MFQALKEWIDFAAGKETKNDDRLAFCLRTLARAPRESLKDKTIVVCRGPELSLRKEGALPERLEPGEVCWVLPAGDVRLPLKFQHENKEIRAVVVLRFEGDRRFALHAADLLASGKDGITEADLACFLAGQWGDLLSLRQISPERFSTQNSSVVSQFRVNLSMLLQENGFRCIEIESVEVLDACISETEPPKLPEAVSEELNAAVEQASTEAGWDRLLDQLDEVGFSPHESEVEALESLGDDYRDKKVSAGDAAAYIRKMIERNTLETKVISGRVARWNAMDVKLRLLDALAEKPEHYRLAATESLSKNEKVPGTWFVLRRHKVDEKLRKYLKSMSGKLAGLLDSATKRQTGLENKARLASTQATLKRISVKLDMTPGLKAGSGSMKRRQRKLDELIATVRRSVTATQLAEVLLRNLASGNYSKEQYLATVADLEATLAALENEIDDRKNVYGL